MRQRVGHGRDSGSERGLSLTSLVIGSVSSAAAAVIVHALWQPGTVVGAALTPVLMALFAEALRRPAERVTVRSVPGDPQHATVELQRPLRRWRQAVLAGLAAFMLGAAGLTISEVVLQRAIADREAGTTLLDGTSRPAPPSGPEPGSPTVEPAPGDSRTPDERRDRESRSGRSDRPGQPPHTPTPSASPAPAQPAPSTTPPPAPTQELP